MHILTYMCRYKIYGVILDDTKSYKHNHDRPKIAAEMPRIPLLYLVWVNKVWSNIQSINSFLSKRYVY